MATIHNNITINSICCGATVTAGGTVANCRLLQKQHYNNNNIQTFTPLRPTKEPLAHTNYVDRVRLAGETTLHSHKCPTRGSGWRHSNNTNTNTIQSNGNSATNTASSSNNNNNNYNYTHHRHHHQPPTLQHHYYHHQHIGTGAGNQQSSKSISHLDLATTCRSPGTTSRLNQAHWSHGRQLRHARSLDYQQLSLVEAIGGGCGPGCLDATGEPPSGGAFDIAEFYWRLDPQDVQQYDEVLRFKGGSKVAAKLNSAAGTDGGGKESASDGNDLEKVTTTTKTTTNGNGNCPAGTQLAVSNLEEENNAQTKDDSGGNELPPQYQDYKYGDSNYHRHSTSSIYQHHPSGALYDFGSDSCSLRRSRSLAVIREETFSDLQIGSGNSSRRRSQLIPRARLVNRGFFRERERYICGSSGKHHQLQHEHQQHPSTGDPQQRDNNGNQLEVGGNQEHQHHPRHHHHHHHHEAGHQLHLGKRESDDYYDNLKRLDALAVDLAEQLHPWHNDKSDLESLNSDYFKNSLHQTHERNPSGPAAATPLDLDALEQAVQLLSGPIGGGTHEKPRIYQSKRQRLIGASCKRGNLASGCGADSCPENSQSSAFPETTTSNSDDQTDSASLSEQEYDLKRIEELFQHHSHTHRHLVDGDEDSYELISLTTTTRTRIETTEDEEDPEEQEDTKERLEGVVNGDGEESRPKRKRLDHGGGLNVVEFLTTDTEIEFESHDGGATSSGTLKRRKTTTLLADGLDKIIAYDSVYLSSEEGSEDTLIDEQCCCEAYGETTVTASVEESDHTSLLHISIEDTIYEPQVKSELQQGGEGKGDGGKESGKGLVNVVEALNTKIEILEKKINEKAVGRDYEAELPVYTQVLRVEHTPAGETLGSAAAKAHGSAPNLGAVTTVGSQLAHGSHPALGSNSALEPSRTHGSTPALDSGRTHGSTPVLSSISPIGSAPSLISGASNLASTPLGVTSSAASKPKILSVVEKRKWKRYSADAATFVHTTTTTATSNNNSKQQGEPHRFHYVEHLHSSKRQVGNSDTPLYAAFTATNGGTDNQYHSLPDVSIGQSLKVSEHIDAKLRSSYNSGSNYDSDPEDEPEHTVRSVAGHLEDINSRKQEGGSCQEGERKQEGDIYQEGGKEQEGGRKQEGGREKEVERKQEGGREKEGGRKQAGGKKEEKQEPASYQDSGKRPDHLKKDTVKRPKTDDDEEERHVQDTQPKIHASSSSTNTDGSGDGKLKPHEDTVTSVEIYDSIKRFGRAHQRARQREHDAELRHEPPPPKVRDRRQRVACQLDESEETAAAAAGQPNPAVKLRREESVIPPAPPPPPPPPPPQPQPSSAPTVQLSPQKAKLLNEHEAEISGKLAAASGRHGIEEEPANATVINRAAERSGGEEFREQPREAPTIEVSNFRRQIERRARELHENVGSELPEPGGTNPFRIIVTDVHDNIIEEDSIESCSSLGSSNEEKGGRWGQDSALGSSGKSSVVEWQKCRNKTTISVCNTLNRVASLKRISGKQRSQARQGSAADGGDLRGREEETRLWARDTENKENKDTRDRRNLKDTQSYKESRDTQDFKEAKNTKDSRDRKDFKEFNNSKDFKKSNNTNDFKESKDRKDFKESRYTKSHKDTNNFKDIKETKDIKEQKDTKFFKDSKDTKDISDQKYSNILKDSKDIKDQQFSKDIKDQKYSKDFKVQDLKNPANTKANREVHFKTNDSKDEKDSKPIKEHKTTKTLKSWKTPKESKGSGGDYVPPPPPSKSRERRALTTTQIYKARPVKVLPGSESFKRAVVIAGQTQAKMSRPQILHVVDKRHPNAYEAEAGGPLRNCLTSDADTEKEYMQKVDSVRNYWSKLALDEEANGARQPEAANMPEKPAKASEKPEKSSEKPEKSSELTQNRELPSSGRHFILGTSSSTSEHLMPPAARTFKDDLSEMGPGSSSYMPSIEIVELDGDKKATIVSAAPPDDDSLNDGDGEPQFDHIRYKVLKSQQLIRNNMLARNKKEAQFDGLIQYLQEYSFQELLSNNNVVIVEPVRTKIERPLTVQRNGAGAGAASRNSTRIAATKSCQNLGAPETHRSGGAAETSASALNGGHGSSEMAHKSSVSGGGGGGGGIKRHFFYQPVRVNRELYEEELPNPDMVRNVRRFFEQNILPTPGQGIRVRGSVSSQGAREEVLETPNRPGETCRLQQEATSNRLDEVSNLARQTYNNLTIDTSYGPAANHLAKLPDAAGQKAAHTMAQRKWETASMSSGVSSGDLSSPCECANTVMVTVGSAKDSAGTGGPQHTGDQQQHGVKGGDEALGAMHVQDFIKMHNRKALLQQQQELQEQHQLNHPPVGGFCRDVELERAVYCEAAARRRRQHNLECIAETLRQRREPDTESGTTEPEDDLYGEPDDDAYDDDDDVCESYYVSNDILEKIREYGSSVTYYGGRVLAPGSHVTQHRVGGAGDGGGMAASQPNEALAAANMTMARARARAIESTNKEQQQQQTGERNIQLGGNEGFKFKLVKSNSCSSRLELAGAGLDIVGQPPDDGGGDVEVVKKMVHHFEAASAAAVEDGEEVLLPLTINNQVTAKRNDTAGMGSGMTAAATVAGSTALARQVTVNNHINVTAVGGGGTDGRAGFAGPGDANGSFVSTAAMDLVMVSAAGPKFMRDKPNYPAHHQQQQQQPQQQTGPEGITAGGPHAGGFAMTTKVCRNKNVDLAFTMAKQQHHQQHQQQQQQQHPAKSPEYSGGGNNNIANNNKLPKPSQCVDSPSDESPSAARLGKSNFASPIEGSGYATATGYGNAGQTAQMNSDRPGAPPTMSQQIIVPVEIHRSCNDAVTTGGGLRPDNEMKSNLSTTSSSTSLIDKTMVRHYVANDKSLFEKRKYDDIEFEEFEVYDPAKDPERQQQHQKQQSPPDGGKLVEESSSLNDSPCSSLNDEQPPHPIESSDGDGDVCRACAIEDDDEEVLCSECEAKEKLEAGQRGQDTETESYYDSLNERL